MNAAPPRGPALARTLLSVALASAFDALLLGLALGGVDPLLRHPRALALLAVWAAGNVAITLSRPPLGRAEATDRDAPHVMLGLVLLPFLAGPLAAWGERAGILRYPWPAGLHALGPVLVAGGLALRAAAMARLGARFAPQVALQSGHALETGGLYRRLRHPGYLGALIATLGAALTFRSALGLVAAVLLLPAVRARVRREDHMLEQRFGAEFRAWHARTGGLWPRGGPAPGG